MVEPGIKGIVTQEVTKSCLASSYGSGALDVFSTPHMIALMEKSSIVEVHKQLESGFTTVGTMVNIEHISSTPLGFTVRAESTLIKVDGKCLTFEVAAYDEIGLIGKGTHGRAIVNIERFLSKAQNKGKQ